MAILFFRERAWKTDYDPSVDTFLDLGAPNEGKREAYMVEEDSSMEELIDEDVEEGGKENELNRPKGEQERNSKRD